MRSAQESYDAYYAEVTWRRREPDIVREILSRVAHPFGGDTLRVVRSLNGNIPVRRLTLDEVDFVGFMIDGEMVSQEGREFGIANEMACALVCIERGYALIPCAMHVSMSCDGVDCEYPGAENFPYKREMLAWLEEYTGMRPVMPRG